MTFSVLMTIVNVKRLRFMMLSTLQREERTFEEIKPMVLKKNIIPNCEASWSMENSKWLDWLTEVQETCGRTGSVCHLNLSNLTDLLIMIYFSFFTCFWWEEHMEISSGCWRVLIRIIWWFPFLNTVLWLMGKWKRKLLGGRK